MNKHRQKLRREFLSLCNLSAAKLNPLAQDASFRCYYRVLGSRQSYILMDAPPDKEQTEPFIKIAKHLNCLGLNAPDILHMDVEHGFILLEDFGDNTFTRLLSEQHDETVLYDLALDTLIKLQTHPRATEVVVPRYTTELLVNEALLLCDWYFEYKTTNKMNRYSRDHFKQCWTCILDSLASIKPTLVLRDYHVDNLVKLSNNQCGLLDFQDAVIGPAAYDIVSLLEDARRDIDPILHQRSLARYFARIDDTDQTQFMNWYGVLGAQRHCKVLGIFTRLSIRDGKSHYLSHIKRVEALLRSHLNMTHLQPLKYWFNENNLKL